MSMDSVRKGRDIPWLKRGMRVEHTYNGKKGRVSGSNGSGNINVIFDGDNWSQNCHPHWMMKYFDKDGELIKEYKG